MIRKQVTALGAPIAIIATMLPVFRVASALFGPDAGWFVGMTVYWLAWCATFSVWLLGWNTVRNFFRPQPVTLEVILLVFAPLVLAAGFRAVTGTGYPKQSLWLTIGWVVSAFANGALEETLWRGVFKEVFDNKVWLRIVWPSLTFGLWHYAPGSVHGDPWLLVAGATCFGFYLSFIVKRTGAVWWAVVIHTFAAFVMIA